MNKYEQALIDFVEKYKDYDTSLEYLILAFVRWIYPIGFDYRKTLLEIVSPPFRSLMKDVDNKATLQWKEWLYIEYRSRLINGYYENNVSVEHIKEQKKVAKRIYDKYKGLQL